MKDDGIRELIRLADSVAGPPPVGADLPERVRNARRREVGTRRMAVAVAALVITVGGVGLWVHDRFEPGRPHVVQKGGSPGEADELRAEIERLREETDRALGLIEEVLARQARQERLAAMNRRLAAMDPLGRVRAEEEKAACIIIYRADRTYRDLGAVESAVRDYRRVTELFPNTYWADVARKRLSEIVDSKGDRL